MHFRHVAFLAGLACAVSASGAWGEEEQILRLPDGFQSRMVANYDPGVAFELQLGGLCYSPDGEPIVYEQGEIRILREEGPHILARFEPAVFGDFLVLHPDGESVVFGESSAGTINAVALDGSGVRILAELQNNFDLAFAPPDSPAAIRGRGFLSAPGTVGNAILLLEEKGSALTDEVITQIPGFSGPLAFDDIGNLYYITSSFEETQLLVRFAAEQVTQGIGEDAIDFSEGEVILSDLESAYGLAWGDGKLYLTNLGFVTGNAAIETVDPQHNFLHAIFATLPLDDTSARPTYLAFDPGPAPFAPGPGADRGRLLVAYSDYSTFTHVAEITPERHFVRGETNGDAHIDIADAIFLLSYLFSAGSAPDPLAAADVNADGALDLSDPVYLLSYLFLGGPVVPPPFPEPGPGGRL